MNLWHSKGENSNFGEKVERGVKSFPIQFEKEVGTPSLFAPKVPTIGSLTWKRQVEMHADPTRSEGAGSNGRMKQAAPSARVWMLVLPPDADASGYQQTAHSGR